MKTIREFPKKVIEHAAASELAHWLMKIGGGGALLSTHFVETRKFAVLVGFIGGALLVLGIVLAWNLRRRAEAQKQALIEAQKQDILKAVAERDRVHHDELQVQAAAHASEVKRREEARVKENQALEERLHAEAAENERRLLTVIDEKFEMLRSNHRISLQNLKKLHDLDLETQEAKLTAKQAAKMHHRETEAHKASQAVNQAKANELVALRRLKTLRAELDETARVQFGNRVEHHHQFQHIARDFSVRLLDFLPPMIGPAAPELSGEDLVYMKRLFNELAATFQLTVPDGVNVFVSLRVRQGTDYVTALRAGRVDNAKRQKESMPLGHRSAIVRGLKHSFREKKCTMMTGIGKTCWTEMPNDRFGADKCTLLGAVFVKKLRQSTGSFAPRKLEWIVAVSADRDGAFSEEHKALLNCFNDTLGLLLNLLARIPPAARKGEWLPFPGSGGGSRIVAA